MASATHTLCLNAQEVCNKYRIDSKTGYEIQSDVEILADEVEKIQRILGAFRCFELHEFIREERESKWGKYTAEHSFANWQRPYEDARKELEKVKEEFKVKEIKVLN
jgi:hypothetical protein